MSSTLSTYIHGSNPEEQARLGMLNSLINERCLALLDIAPGSRVIDFGSGLGQFTILMGHLVGPGGYCLGIERDQAQLTRAVSNLKASGLGHIEFRFGNVEELLLKNEEEGGFDLAHARFVLEHVRYPDKVVNGMVKAVGHGGRVVILDDDHDTLRLHPQPDGFPTLWSAYMKSYEQIGNDPLIGRRLVSLLADEGLTSIRNNVVFFGDCAGTKTFSAYASNLQGILEGAKTLMLDEKLLSETEFTAGMAGLSVWSAMKDAALWYSINWATGTRP